MVTHRCLYLVALRCLGLKGGVNPSSKFRSVKCALPHMGNFYTYPDHSSSCYLLGERASFLVSPATFVGREIAAKMRLGWLEGLHVTHSQQKLTYTVTRED